MGDHAEANRILDRLSDALDEEVEVQPGHLALRDDVFPFVPAVTARITNFVFWWALGNDPRDAAVGSALDELGTGDALMTAWVRFLSGLSLALAWLRSNGPRATRRPR